MRFIWFALFWALSIFSVCAQGKVKVTGNVITTDGKPAEFITVSLKNTTFGGLTDADGRFTFMAPAGDYILVVQSISTHREEMAVKLVDGKDNIFKNIKTKENINQLEEVVVTGQFSPQSMRKSLYKVKSISSETIRLKAPATVEALLNTEIGIRISNDMALGESNFELMGMSGNNVKILLDGVALLDRGSKKQSLSQLDVNNIERVEIVEGPMSVVYGTDALAGVINIITKKGKGLSSKNTWSVNARIQEESLGKEYDFFNNDGQHNESVDMGMTFRNGLYFNGSWTRNNNGGWQGDMTGREKRWHPKEQYLMGGMVGFRRHNLNVWYRLNYTDETIFTPYQTSRPELIRDKDFLTDRYNHQLQGDWNLNNKLIMNFALSYQDYKRRTRTVFTRLDKGDRWYSQESGGQDVTKYNSWNARVTATWNISPKFSLQPGLEYQRTEGSGDRVAGTNSIEDLAFFLSAEYKPLNWLSLRPGVRTFLSTSYDAPFAVPSVLTKFNLNPEMDLRLSYAYGFRTPTVQEMYMDFTHQDNHITGNPDLKAEYSHNVTASYNYRILHNERVRLTTSVGGFFNIFKDRIGITQSLTDPTIHTHYNIDKYKTLGGTFESSLAWGNLNANLNFSLVGRYNQYSNEVNADSQFRYSPEVSSNISYTLPKWGTNLSFYYKFTGERAEYYTDTDASDKVFYYVQTIPSFNYGDFTVTQKLTKFLKLNCGVKNIFDLTSIQTRANSDMVTNNPTLYMGCGRSWFVGLSVNLDGKF